MLGFKRTFERVANINTHFLPAMGYRVQIYPKRYFDPEVKAEMVQYKLDYKKTVKRLRDEYWERQTEIENEWIEDYRERRKDKEERDLRRFRTSIVKIAMHTHNHVEDLKQREDKRNKMFIKKDI